MVVKDHLKHISGLECIATAVVNVTSRIRPGRSQTYG